MTFPNNNHHEWNCFHNISLSLCRAWIGSSLSHRDVLYTALSPPHLSEKPRNVQKEAKLSEYAHDHLLGQDMQGRSKWMQYCPQMMSKGGKQIMTDLRFDICSDIVDFKLIWDSVGPIWVVTAVNSTYYQHVPIIMCPTDYPFAYNPTLVKSYRWRWRSSHQ